MNFKKRNKIHIITYYTITTETIICEKVYCHFIDKVIRPD